MLKNTSKSELRQAVRLGMRQYLGHHPEAAFSTALDLTALVAERSTGAALLEWRDRLYDLNKHVSNADILEPDFVKNVKRLQKRKRVTRKA